MKSQSKTTLNQPKDYISATEVSRACKEIGIRDWARLKNAKVTAREAKIILNIVNTEKMPIDLKEFVAGLDVELEHGTRFKDAECHK